MAKPGTQLKGKRRRDGKKFYAAIFGDKLTPTQEKLMLKEDAKMSTREPVKTRPMSWADMSTGHSNT